MNSISNNKRKRIAVFASGNGSNLQAIVDYSLKNDINGDVVFVLSNNPSAYALERAKNADIKSICIDSKKFVSRQEYDREILKVLKNENIDLICLAGYMLLFTLDFINEYLNKLINIHPSLLPSFKGKQAIKDAFDYGVRITGATVHFVEFEIDNGPIILQEAVQVSEKDTLDELENKIHKVEHRIYPLAVKYFCRDELKINGRKVSILERS
ncbi:MAG: phosphoribosylglycinamide formyltransferase [Actinobacteria bacterium]|nr:phosphoribosylglycinamide formyltransferase [Actinomycetota bacterium]MCL6086814.1 phosphoribosylglycinamide formyltransferase [Actinomycetota bacterium]